jgi:hypothetical protein
VPVSAPIILDACPTSLLAANAIRSMQFIGVDSSRLRGRIAKSVLPSFLRANWGVWLSYRRAEPEWTVRQWLRDENVSQGLDRCADDPDGPN